jgi:hypothetical protein
MTANPVNYLLDALAQVGPAILILLAGYFLARKLKAVLTHRLTPIPALDGREVGVIANIAFWWRSASPLPLPWRPSVAPAAC